MRRWQMNNFAKIQLNLIGVMLVVTYANAGILSLREHKIKYDFQKQEEVINLASLNASYDFLLIENQLLNKKLQYTQKVLRNERKKGLYYHLNLNLMPFKAITDGAVYLSAFNQTLKHEGGLGIDNNGYAVNYGINQKWYRPFKGMPKTVNDLNKQFASKYYYFKYFKPLNLNANYSQVYINFIFDTAVNKSVRVAFKKLVCKRKHWFM
jgi:Glycosyl hydrolase 108